MITPPIVFIVGLIVIIGVVTFVVTRSPHR